MHMDDFNLLTGILKGKSGLVLTPDKSYLLESRLTPIARKWNLRGIEDLCLKVKNQDREVIEDIVEAMTTNESSFYRDTKPFEQFKTVLLPRFMQSRASTKKLRIWSAACSSGQEAYSLVMILKELSNIVNGWQFDILGTDISKSIVDRAKQGIYSQFEVQRGLPITLLVKFFEQKGDKWQIKEEIRNAVKYQVFNLLDDYASLGKFDIVFCRNVLIYFDPDTKAKVLNKIAKIMSDDGILLLGGAETVLGITNAFKPIENNRGLYEKVAVTETSSQFNQLKAAG